MLSRPRANRRAGAREQVAALAARAAAHVSLGGPGAVARLLRSLWEAGAREQATALADRALLDDLRAVAWLLDRLREAGAEQQVAALAARAAAHAPLEDPLAVEELLHILRWVRAWEQAAALLDRDPAAHVSLDDPGAVAKLLNGPAGGRHVRAFPRARGPPGSIPVWPRG